MSLRTEALGENLSNQQSCNQWSKVVKVKEVKHVSSFLLLQMSCYILEISN